MSTRTRYVGLSEFGLTQPGNWMSPQRVGWARPSGTRARSKWKKARASGRR